MPLGGEVQQPAGLGEQGDVGGVPGARAGADGGGEVLVGVYSTVMPVSSWKDSRAALKPSASTPPKLPRMVTTPSPAAPPPDPPPSPSPLESAGLVRQPARPAAVAAAAPPMTARRERWKRM